jgi:prepilin-type N-terminal cleavage/methylation domain-containing protein
MKNRGITLIELIIVLVILAAVVGMFYTVFFSNWLGLEQELARIELGYQADLIRTRFTQDVLPASSFNLPPLPARSVTLSYPANAAGAIPADVVYSFIGLNQLQRQQGANTETLSGNIDLARSNFGFSGSSLVMNLFLEDNILGRRVELNYLIQAFPRRSR